MSAEEIALAAEFIADRMANRVSHPRLWDTYKRAAIRGLEMYRDRPKGGAR